MEECDSRASSKCESIGMRTALRNWEGFGMDQGPKTPLGEGEPCKKNQIKGDKAARAIWSD